MKLYFVRSRNGDYVFISPKGYVFWGPKNQASVYQARTEALVAGKYATEEHFDIVEIDTGAALEVLRDCFEVRNLDDYTAQFVLKWVNAVHRAEKLLKESEAV